MTSKELAKIAVKAMDDKKCENIKVIDISSISSIGDYFIIGNGDNINQVHAISDNVDEMLAKEQYFPKQVEGYQNGNWILMDYGDIIIHIFDKENRVFYNLERIWKDGKEVEL